VRDDARSASWVGDDEKLVKCSTRNESGRNVERLVEVENRQLGTIK